MPNSEIYHKILKKYWGYDEFRPLQLDIIESIGAGKDTLGLMPTGGGKSICFQVPTMAMEGLCIVVTPLIALMKDQVENIEKNGIHAYAIHSGHSHKEILSILEQCERDPRVKFLYVSPERLESELFLKRLKFIPVSLITVDEAHCISQWGYDFRPPYLRIAEIRKLLPNVPVLALTATATPDVVLDIQDQLKFHERNVFTKSFSRENLAYIVRYTRDKVEQLLHILNNVPGSAVVYVRNRRNTVNFAQVLNDNNITATYYHAGLSDEQKNVRQKKWKDNEFRVMVATNAFGMGIDKPDVRVVIHMNFPNSLEEYYQEAGRAGRDGKTAYGVLLVSEDDETKVMRRIEADFPNKEQVFDIYQKVVDYYEVSEGKAEGRSYPFDLIQFCTTFRVSYILVESALQILSMAGYINYQEQHESISKLKFLVTREQLYDYKENSKAVSRVLETILRLYTGLFADMVTISVKQIAARSEMAFEDVHSILTSLRQEHILLYIPYKRMPLITFIRNRVAQKDLAIPTQIYEERKERFSNKIKALVEYSRYPNDCRSRLLLRYFGEESSPYCGRCDVCINYRKQIRAGVNAKDIVYNPNYNKTKPDMQLAETILELLKSNPQSYPAIIQSYKGNTDVLCETLKYLLVLDKIKMNDRGQYCVC